MKINWKFESIEFKKKTFVLTMSFYNDNLRGWIITTYDRNKNTCKHQMQTYHNETKLFGEKLENFLLDSFKQDELAKECIVDLQIFNGILQKELEQGKFKIYKTDIFDYYINDRVSDYIIELKNLDFEIEAELDDKHNIEKLTLTYRYKKYDILPLLDMTTYMEIIEKIHQKLRLRELFDKGEE